ncbi:uncharacterized protein KIAA2026-like isoform X2 [Limulus polyphemus]|uniref:Uncharacterized protein KIAA2026-like isoform X2 n=1 Tax=Limulus polyphemus TaxID=6850 RepID=A0ABM1TL34_LIMPO|nr:uncharacterized protein KIAA2026-like isoform X2 [Limulus polyphemus]
MKMDTETCAIHDSVEKTRNNGAYGVPGLSEIDQGDECEEIKLLDPSESRTQQTQTSLEDSEGSWNSESNVSHSSTLEKELHEDSDMDSENSVECLESVSFVDESMEHTIDSKTLPKKGRKPRRIEFLPAHLDCELIDAFRVVSYLMSESNKNINWPFLEAVRDNDPSCPDYYEVIVKPVWLSKVKLQILDGQYSTITNVVRDLRQMFANCYLYNGASHPISKRALKLETVLEQRLALLPKELIEKTSLKVTSPEFAEETVGTVIRRKTRYNGDHSMILSHMMKERSLRAKEAKRRQVDMKRAEQEAAVQKLPQIGHFLYLTQRILNIPDVTQYELERAFLIPQASSLMCAIMTTLLSNPQDRAKLDQKSKMPYKVWHERLKIRINTFYKVFTRKNKNPLKVFETLGVEPDFFKVLGPTNLLEHKPFHKLSLQQKVWIVKSLCDYCLHSHSTITESLNELPVEDQKEQALGKDREGNTYIYFPHFWGQEIRIYRTAPWTDQAIPSETIPDWCDYPQYEMNEEQERLEDIVKDEVHKKKEELGASPYINSCTKNFDDYSKDNEDDMYNCEKEFLNSYKDCDKSALEEQFDNDVLDSVSSKAKCKLDSYSGDLCNDDDKGDDRLKSDHLYCKDIKLDASEEKQKSSGKNIVVCGEDRETDFKRQDFNTIIMTSVGSDLSETQRETEDQENDISSSVTLDHNLNYITDTNDINNQHKKEQSKCKIEQESNKINNTCVSDSSILESKDDKIYDSQNFSNNNNKPVQNEIRSQSLELHTFKDDKQSQKETETVDQTNKIGDETENSIENLSGFMKERIVLNSTPSRRSSRINDRRLQALAERAQSFITTKNPEKSEKKEVCEPKSTKEEEKEPHIYSIEPNIKKFELVAHSVDCLRKLLSNFENNESQKKGKGKNRKNICETHLCNQLRALLAEVEPWETKLHLTERRIRMRLKKEWEDFQKRASKNNEMHPNVWSTEFNEQEDSSESSSVSEDESTAIKTGKRGKNKLEYISDSYEVSVSSRGRKRKLRRLDLHEDVLCGKVTKPRNLRKMEENGACKEKMSPFQVSVSSRGRVRKLRLPYLDEEILTEKMPRFSFQSKNVEQTNQENIHRAENESDKNTDSVKSTTKEDSKSSQIKLQEPQTSFSCSLSFPTNITTFKGILGNLKPNIISKTSRSITEAYNSNDKLLKSNSNRITYTSPYSANSSASCFLLNTIPEKNKMVISSSEAKQTGSPVMRTHQSLESSANAIITSSSSVSRQPKKFFKSRNSPSDSETLTHSNKTSSQQSNNSIFMLVPVVEPKSGKMYFQVVRNNDSRANSQNVVSDSFPSTNTGNNSLNNIVSRSPSHPKVVTHIATAQQTRQSNSSNLFPTAVSSTKLRYTTPNIQPVTTKVSSSQSSSSPINIPLSELLQQNGAKISTVATSEGTKLVLTLMPKTVSSISSVTTCASSSSSSIKSGTVTTSVITQAGRVSELQKVINGTMSSLVNSTNQSHQLPLKVSEPPPLAPVLKQNKIQSSSTVVCRNNSLPAFSNPQLKLCTTGSVIKQCLPLTQTFSDEVKANVDFEDKRNNLLGSPPVEHQLCAPSSSSSSGSLEKRALYLQVSNPVVSNVMSTDTSTPRSTVFVMPGRNAANVFTLPTTRPGMYTLKPAAKQVSVIRSSSQQLSSEVRSAELTGQVPVVQQLSVVRSPFSQLPVVNSSQVVNPAPQLSVMNSQQIVSGLSQLPIIDNQQIINEIPQLSLIENQQIVSGVPQISLVENQQVVGGIPQISVVNDQQIVSGVPQISMINNQTVVNPVPQLSVLDNTQMVNTVTSLPVVHNNTLQQPPYSATETQLVQSPGEENMLTQPASNSPGQQYYLLTSTGQLLQVSPQKNNFQQEDKNLQDCYGSSGVATLVMSGNVSQNLTYLPG